MCAVLTLSSTKFWHPHVPSNKNSFSSNKIDNVLSDHVVFLVQREIFAWLINATNKPLCHSRKLIAIQKFTLGEVRGCNPDFESLKLQHPHVPRNQNSFSGNKSPVPLVYLPILKQQSSSNLYCTPNNLIIDGTGIFTWSIKAKRNSKMYCSRKLNSFQ